MGLILFIIFSRKLGSLGKLVLKYEPRYCKEIKERREGETASFMPKQGGNFKVECCVEWVPYPGTQAKVFLHLYGAIKKLYNKEKNNASDTENKIQGREREYMRREGERGRE